jgi:tetratricopeptide (TPR) repeat protein
LYTEELCRLDPRQGNSIWASSSAGSRGDAVAAGWLASLVGARVEQLPEAAQALLETAAVIGQAPPRWLLDAMLGPQTVASLLPALMAADFLSPAGNDGEIEFSHGITWEIIYSLIPLATRQRLHAAVADALTGRSEAPVIDLEESLAWHFLASGQAARAWPHAERAGDRAVRLGSLDRAQLHYRRAIDTLAQLPVAAQDSHSDRGLVRKFGYVCIFDADPAQFPAFAAAIERARHRGDTLAEAEAEYWLGYVAHGGGSNRAAIAHCRRALDLVADAPASRFAVQVRATLGQAYAVATDYGRAIPLLDEAIAIKRQHRSGAKASTGLAYSLAQRAAVHADMGNFTAARAMINEAQGMLGDESPPVEASIMAWVAVIAAWDGDWPALLAAANHGCDVALRIEAVYIHAICRAFAAFARWQMGGGDAAADALAAAVDCMVDRRKSLALSIAWGFLAEVEVARGNHAGARRAVAGAFARARAGDPMGVGWAARAWACHLAETDPARARVYLARAWTNARQRQSGPEMARCADIERRLELAFNTRSRPVSRLAARLAAG